MRLIKEALATALACLLFAGSAQAVTQLIGDVDGFGFDPTGLVAASGAPADTDGDGRIEPGEFLPDLNGNGNVQVNGGDDFDNRSGAEQAAVNGAEWTDVSLVGNGAANGATFTFTFPVPAPGAFDYGQPHFINFVFGDYDVSPATIDVDGTVYPLTLQGGQGDGLVQLAFAVVPFSDLADGQLVITVIAPNEPYLAFDFALLDTEALQTVTDITIDIKPGSDPNSINLRSRGVLPVAILGSEQFDALAVDPATVLLGDPGLSGTAAPIRDAAEDVNADGWMDLLLHFRTQALVANGALDASSEEARLTGETLDGFSVEGSDAVRIVPPAQAASGAQGLQSTKIAKLKQKQAGKR